MRMFRRAEIGGIEDGQTVNFSVDAFPGRTFNGRVKQIRNSFTTVQNVVTYDTVIEVSNPDLKLRPGMTATASIVTAQRSGALKIPNAALRFKPLNEPKLHPRPTRLPPLPPMRPPQRLPIPMPSRPPAPSRHSRVMSHRRN